MHAIIDNAVDKKAWVIFMCHFRNSYTDGYYFDSDVLASVIDTVEYAVSNGCIIETAGTAFERFKNRLKTLNMTVDCDGVIT